MASSFDDIFPDAVSAPVYTAGQESAQRIADLRSVLPPVRRNDVAALDSLTGLVACDTEWDRVTRELTLIGVGNAAVIVQLWWKELTPEQHVEAGAALIRVLQRCTTIFHNADADIRTLRANGVSIELHRDLRLLEDTMLAHGVLHSEEAHDLEYLSAELGKLPVYKDLQGVDLGTYNACDVIETSNVWYALQKELAADPRAEHVYCTRRLSKLPFVIHGEERGIAVNQPLVYPVHDELTQKREQALLYAGAYCGWPINLASTKDLHFWAYDVEGFPVQRAKAAPGTEGPPTLNKDALATLRRQTGVEWDPDEPPTFEDAVANVEGGGNPFLEARYLFYGAQQSLSHYVDPCLVWEGEKIIGVRDTLYPETRQHVQASGRESVVGTDWPGRAGIPMQQLRGRTELLVRPRPGTIWWGWDWSNIETWILGELANDPLLREAKLHGHDTHTLNVCDVFRLPRPPILTKQLHTADACLVWRLAHNWAGDEDLRRLFIKRWVYRLHYRGNPKYAVDIPGAKLLGVNAARSEEMAEAYLALHHWIPEFWRTIEHEVDTTGAVYAPGGMPRRLTSPSKWARYREACNHPLQGGVAWIYDTVRLLIHKTFPWAEFMYGKHDSQWWEIPLEREAEFNVVARAVVEMPFEINGRQVSFPASWKRRTE